MIAHQGAADRLHEGGLNSGQLKGDGQLASTKWCMSTLACFLKRIYTEKNRHSESVPMHGV